MPRSTSQKASSIGLSFRQNNQALNDELGRNPFALSLAQVILNQPNDECCVIGLEGEWGSGKSYTLSLIKRAIERISKENSKPVGWVVFNPWNFKDREDLISVFLRQLSQALILQRPVLTRTQRAFVWFNTGVPGAVRILEKVQKLRWLSPLLDCVGLAGAATGSAVALAIVSEGLKDYAEIADGLKDSNHPSNDGYLKDIKDNLQKQFNAPNFPFSRLIIVMEDIDRLMPEEVMSIMQLVRGVADFQKTTYLLAYDRKQVVEAIGSYSWKHAEEADSRRFGEGYLQKVVDAAFTMPLVPAQTYNDFLLSRWKKIAIKVYGAKFEKDSYWQQAEFVLFNIFHTVREADRVFNRALLITHMLDNKSNPVDALFAAYCMEFQPRLWAWLNVNMGALLRGGRHLLKSENRTSRDKPVQYGHLEDNIVGTPSEREKVIDLCKLVFPSLMYDSSETDKDQRKKFRICTPEYWESYFRYEVSKTAIVHEIIHKQLLKSSGQKRFELIGTIKAYGDQASYELTRELREIHEARPFKWNNEALPLLVDLAKNFDTGQETRRADDIYWLCVQWVNKLDEKLRAQAFVSLITTMLSNDIKYISISLVKKYGVESGIIKLEPEEKKSKTPLNLKLSKTQSSTLWRAMLSSLHSWAGHSPSDLLDHPRLSEIIFTWLRLDEQSSKAKIEEWIKSDFTFMKLLKGFTYEGATLGLETPQGAVRELRISMKSLLKVLPGATEEDIKTKVEEFSSSSHIYREFSDVIDAVLRSGKRDEDD